MAHPYLSDNKVLEELLIMYRSTACLWNPTHIGYTNKVTRRKAMETLLVKFRELDPSAHTYTLKRKLENMRNAYKRHRIKVLRSRQPSGRGESLYVPTLWYYPLMRFLDELDPCMSDDAALDDDNNDHSNDNAEEDIDIKHYVGSDSPPHKKPKPSAVYITDEGHDYEIHSPAKVRKLKYSSDEEEPPYLIQKSGGGGELPRAEWASPSAAVAGDLFGRAMTTRLNDLLPQQRFIAEKLISDVIFLGRLNKLKTGSTINVNDDCY